MKSVSLSFAAAVTALVLTACGGAAASRVGGGRIVAVGAENQYANVISQIGGRYVAVTAIEHSPNADPHSFEASPSIAQTVAAARLIVQNGLGYDTFMDRIESGSASRSRRVIVVQHLLGLPDSTANPHLWYMPRTMPALARELAAELSAIAPAHRAYFAANARRFESSLEPFQRALVRFARRYPHTQVAVTEPLADYLLRAAGAVLATPFALQADVMNGVDPAPQAIAYQNELLARHRVAVLVYNQQVTDTLTASFLAQARSGHVPVVGFYETMPEPGYDYQSWMLAEVNALERAVADHVSTERLR